MASMLVQHCTNVILMFCVCWEGGNTGFRMNKFTFLLKYSRVCEHRVVTSVLGIRTSVSHPHYTTLYTFFFLHKIIFKGMLIYLIYIIASESILLYVAFSTTIAISRQEGDRSRQYAVLLSNDSKGPL